MTEILKFLHILTAVVLFVLTATLPSKIHAQRMDKSLYRLWRNPTAEHRMKIWWFFGYERTTDEGIHADIEALHDAGFGGVVYYDQNHAKDPIANGAEKAFSFSWWHHLRYAAEEAKRTGLSFEINISNGYCAGGRWIDPAHAMQRVAYAELYAKGGERLSITLPDITEGKDFLGNIAILAFPAHEDSLFRYFTARYRAAGKGRNGAMQGPISSSKEFSGYGFSPLPCIGTLQASDDSTTWRNVTRLMPMYRSQGGYFVRTTAFPAMRARAWRVMYDDGSFSYEGQTTGALNWWHVGSEAKMNRWEELSALHSDFAEGNNTPAYSAHEVIDPHKVINLTDSITGDTLHCTLPPGKWKILRLAAVTTGARSKHGRPELLGYECDKLSSDAAVLHWNSYVQPILDSLNSPSQRLIAGITMDSHEGGAQNWTPQMMNEFSRRRGYDFSPWLPTLAGYVVESVEKTEQALYDYRQTISECIRDNYFATFQRLCTEQGLSFTAQAIGNALCITGDAISVKQAVEKPQGEFWTYQQEGAYDVKDCSSAAHLYGKPIASAEAMTDCEYNNSPADLHRVASIAFSMGAQEFVVCATPHIPLATTTEPYIAGREYAINRSNPQWHDMKPVWLQAARSMVMLRQGKAAPDALVFIGDDVPVKTLTHRLPPGLSDLDWDVCTADALARLHVENNRLITPEGIEYGALLIGKEAHTTQETQQLIDSIRSKGVRVLTSGESIDRPLIIEQGGNSIVHTHRKMEDSDFFYLANKENRPTKVTFRIKGNPKKLTLWSNMTGKRHNIKPSSNGSFSITLSAMETGFITVHSS